MKQQVQPDRLEQPDEDTATPLINPEQEEQQEVDTAQSQVQPDRLEQPDEDTATPLIQPDQEEQQEENMVISLMRNIWKKITKNS